MSALGTVIRAAVRRPTGTTIASSWPAVGGRAVSLRPLCGKKYPALTSIKDSLMLRVEEGKGIAEEGKGIAEGIVEKLTIVDVASIRDSFIQELREDVKNLNAKAVQLREEVDIKESAMMLAEKTAQWAVDKRARLEKESAAWSDNFVKELTVSVRMWDKLPSLAECASGMRKEFQPEIHPVLWKINFAFGIYLGACIFLLPRIRAIQAQGKWGTRPALTGAKAVH